MQETVAINELTLCHKHSDGWVRATLPDVCKAPSTPVPFSNIAHARDLAKGSITVESHGGAMCGIKGSEFSISEADDGGVGGGIISGVYKHRATWLSWSPDVFMEGKPVTRLTDRMLMNKGNTISAGGYFTGPVVGASKLTLDLLCDIACDCIAMGTARQRCVHEAVKQTPKTPTNGIYSEVTFDPAGTMLRNPDGSPQTRYAVPGSRLDIVTVAAGSPIEFIEMKFGPDTMGPTQQQRYRNIAALNGKALQEIWVDRDCKCATPQPVPVPSRSTANDEEGLSTGSKVAIGLGATAAAIGVIACAVAEPCGAGAIAALLFGGSTLAVAQ